MSGLRVLLATLLSLLFPTAAAARGPSPDQIEKLRGDIATILEAEGVPGVGIALVTRERVVWAGGVGLADRERGVEVDADTHFRVGSITKSFIALTALRLAERGEVDLRAAVARYAPDVEIDNRWASQSPITLAHVLEHSAGFDDMRFNESGSASTPELSVSEALAINPRSRISRWRPGDRFAYANPGTTVAARVIEHVTGEPFESALRKEVLDPLGMQTAGFRLSPEISAKLAQGYGADGVTPARFWVTPHRPAGHLMASPRELAKLVLTLLRRGDGVVQPSSIDRMERSETRGHTVPGLAYGLANYGDVSFPVPGRGHDGGLPGFISEYKYFPSLGVGYVLLYNSNNVLMAHLHIRRLVFETLTTGLEIPCPEAYTPTQAELDAVVGTWEHTSPRHEIFAFLERLLMSMRIEAVDGTVWMELGIGVRVPLVPTGPGEFSLRGLSGPVLKVFDGEHLLLAESSYVRGSAIKAVARRQGVIWGSRVVLLAPVVLLAWLVFWPVHRGRRSTLRLLALPAAAAASILALPWLLSRAAAADVLGVMHSWTVAFFVATLVATALAGASLARAIRGLWQHRVSTLARLFALVVAIACFGLVLWLRAGHIIGLRTWAW